MGIKSWPTWGCEASEFDWSYDEQETCYVLHGQVTVESPEQTVSFGPGDLVVFPKGLSCKWKVTKAVKKHYQFG
jgi:uncharacterized cupin superfamily protein